MYMINDNLEQDLVTYSKTKNKNLFTTKLYDPISFMLTWIISRQYRTCNESDLDDLRQCCMLRVIKDMHYYKTGKGKSATSFLRMLLQQELHKQKKKYDNHYTESIEYNPDIDNRTYDPITTNESITSPTEVFTNYLSNNITTTEQQAVITSILYILEHNPQNYLKLNVEQQQAAIARRSKQSIETVKATISKISQAQV